MNIVNLLYGLGKGPPAKKLPEKTENIVRGEAPPSVSAAPSPVSPAPRIAPARPVPVPAPDPVPPPAAEAPEPPLPPDEKKEPPREMHIEFLKFIKIPDGGTERGGAKKP